MIRFVIYSIDFVMFVILINVSFRYKWNSNSNILFLDKRINRLS